MNNLLGSLGLDEVESDPNLLPDGRWAGVVRDSKYVLVKSSNTVSHVITYRVTEGNRKNAERAEFFRIGKDPVFTEGHEGDVNFIESMTPVMSEDNKRWYKKRFVDLGIPEDKVSSTDISELVGKPVTFGTKKNGEYINISFVELREEGATPDAPVTGLL